MDRNTELTLKFAERDAAATGGDWADFAALAISHDIRDRRGLKSAWHEADAGIQAEILLVWAALIRAADTRRAAPAPRGEG